MQQHRSVSTPASTPSATTRPPRASLAEVIDLLERLGMRRELAEARGQLAQLDERTMLLDR
jgi:hypothetical protein